MTQEEKKIEETANRIVTGEFGSYGNEYKFNIAEKYFSIGAYSEAAKEYWQKGMYSKDEVEKIKIDLFKLWNHTIGLDWIMDEVEFRMVIDKIFEK